MKIPVFRPADARRLKAISQRQVPLGQEAASAAFPDDDGVDIYIIRVADMPIPAADLDGDQIVPGKLRLPIYQIPHGGDEALEAAADDVGFDVYNLQFEESPTDIFGLAVRERMTGRLIFVASLGGEECECECVHELAIANSPTGGTIGLTYTIEGTTGSLVTINHNHSATSIRDAIVAGNSAKLTNDNLKVYGGPLPMVSVYIRFTADLAGLFIPVPSVSNALTGTNVSPKYGIFQTPGWS